MEKPEIAHLYLVLAIDHMTGDWIVRSYVEIRDGKAENRERHYQRIRCFTQTLRLVIAYPELAAIVDGAVKNAPNPREQEKRFFTAIATFVEKAELKCSFFGQPWPEWESLL